MKYAVMVCSNGNFSVNSEWVDDLQGAVVRWHQLCASLWNASDVVSANVRIVDEHQYIVDGRNEDIDKSEKQQSEVPKNLRNPAPITETQSAEEQQSESEEQTE